MTKMRPSVKCEGYPRRPSLWEIERKILILAGVVMVCIALLIVGW